MKAFNLKEYHENPSRKVVTRDGRPVRIICTDSDAEGGPIVAIVTRDDKKNIVLYYDNGTYFGLYRASVDDLFFAPNKHTDYINLYHNEDGYSLGAVFSSEKEAKEIATIDKDYITTIKAEWED